MKNSNFPTPTVGATGQPTFQPGQPTIPHTMPGITDTHNDYAKNAYPPGQTKSGVLLIIL